MSTAPEQRHEQDYLARDYQSFRDLMIARLSAEIPDWEERCAADMTIAVIEAMAYAGDLLSYQQDAVGAEAYLETARRRVSIRRHARLLDYRLGEGANARAWVRFETTAEAFDLPAGAPVLAAGPGAPPRIGEARLESHDGVIFETMAPACLQRRHNRMVVADGAAALRPAARGCELVGAYPDLARGDVLALRLEGRGAPDVPRLVRILSATVSGEAGVAATRIEWAADDRAPEIDLDPARLRGAACVAEGNFALCDHGFTRRARIPPADAHGVVADAPPTRWLTHAAPPPAPDAAPLAALNPDPSAAIAAVSLREARVAPEHIAEALPQVVWRARRDLMASGGETRDFVVEIDADRTQFIRFGDGRCGRRPPAGVAFEARFREGQGEVGNVGPGALNQIVGADLPITKVENPVAAAGGVDPETEENARLAAPAAPRRRRACVLDADYAAAVSSMPDVASAHAVRGVGAAARSVTIFVRRSDGAKVDGDFAARVDAALALRRMIGDRIIVEDASRRRAAHDGGP